ncbi:hypothetical protein GLOTRDRAFT_95326 [Gloeophyllum trabeum ATCC 11539]|uniref:Uncharacterized protein n=1 Tax=Gloeophyllum trabeum (strain ATCC 11539 / FP-39264 / Madison 617) TaxID=670483 RepID=S7Q0S3_GLOTA|nr:uncharacterized protein GLOTRDRAFT_95326 [Gloeophyllum trabeum ATCC 11539]EPQ53368.1 hypothetical protein GLOTRDRAFT_95326 [Gloeophyllum trabeum ATCC 11539]
MSRQPRRSAQFHNENAAEGGQMRPVSRYWLERGGWIDGAVNPPQYYYSNEEIEHTRQAAFTAIERSGAPLANVQTVYVPAQRRVLAPSPARQGPRVAAEDQAQPPPPYEPPLPYRGQASQGSAARAEAGVPEEPRGPPSDVQEIRENAPTAPGSAPAGTDGPGVLANAPASANNATNGAMGRALGGNVVAVTLVYTVKEKGPSTRGSRVVSKKTQVTKNALISFSEDLGRADFVAAMLKAHDLADQYAAGPHAGPGFKIWWTGVNKTAAATIDTDDDFAIAIGAILRKRPSSITAELNADNMDGFRIRKRPLAAAMAIDEDNELLDGTMVPRLDMYSDEMQLHGGIIMELKALHKCTEHLGENGDTGYCYKTENGHVRLNNRRFKMWAAAIQDIIIQAAHESTKSVPPNTAEFDGLSSQAMPSTPKHRRIASPPLSPLPEHHTDLHSCLLDFLNKQGVDFLVYEESLAEKRLTPDILGKIPAERLCTITGAVEGDVWKLREFATEWQARLLKKRSHVQAEHA